MIGRSDGDMEENIKTESDTNSFDAIGWEKWYAPASDEHTFIKRFGAIGWATLIYALVFGICLYKGFKIIKK